MKGTLLSLILALATLAEPAYAQFGGGIVLDPTQSAHAAQQLIQGSQLYTTTIKTTQNVMETYNLAQRMLLQPPAQIGSEIELRRKEHATVVEQRNAGAFDKEMEKLDRWGDDQRVSLKTALSDLDESIRTSKKEARQAPSLPEKLALEKNRRQLEGKRDEAWRAYDEAARAVDDKKDALLDDIAARLKQSESLHELFTIRWHLQ